MVGGDTRNRMRAPWAWHSDDDSDSQFCAYDDMRLENADGKCLISSSAYDFEPSTVNLTPAAFELVPMLPDIVDMLRLVCEYRAMGDNQHGAELLREASAMLAKIDSLFPSVPIQPAAEREHDPCPRTQSTGKPTRPK